MAFGTVGGVVLASASDDGQWALCPRLPHPGRQGSAAGWLNLKMVGKTAGRIALATGSVLSVAFGAVRMTVTRSGGDDGRCGSGTQPLAHRSVNLNRPRPGSLGVAGTVGRVTVLASASYDGTVRLEPQHRHTGQQGSAAGWHKHRRWFIGRQDAHRPHQLGSNGGVRVCRRTTVPRPAKTTRRYGSGPNHWRTGQ